jgi:hypothetical protein
VKRKPHQAGKRAEVSWKDEEDARVCCPLISCKAISVHSLVKNSNWVLLTTCSSNGGLRDNFLRFNSFFHWLP